MSRIGNKPIVIPEGVEVKANGMEILVKGSKGELTTKVADERIKFEITPESLVFSRSLKSFSTISLVFVSSVEAVLLAFLR